MQPDACGAMESLISEKRSARNRKKKTFFDDESEDEVEWIESGKRVFAKTDGVALRDTPIANYPEDAPTDSFSNRVERRRDATPLPTYDTWSYQPTSKDGFVSVGRDHTCTAQNAASVVWPEYNVRSSECGFHGGITHWSKDKAEHIDNSPPGGEPISNMKVRKLMDVDFAIFRSCPFAHIIPHMKLALLEYWSAPCPDGKGQKKLAEMWYSTYCDSRLTSVEANEGSCLRGGIPSTNNMIERGNRADKEYGNYQKVSPLELLSKTTKMLKEYSITDLSFIGDMKSEVHSSRFLKAVVMTIDARTHRTPSFLETKLQFRNCFRNLSSKLKNEWALSPQVLLVPTFKKISAIAKREK